MIRKPLQFCDVKTHQIKRSSEATKNELLRDLLKACVNNRLKSRDVVFGIWFAAAENLEAVLGASRHFAAAEGQPAGGVDSGKQTRRPFYQGQRTGVIRQASRAWLAKRLRQKNTFESVVLYEPGRQHGHVEPDLQRSLLRRHTGRDD